MSVTTFRRRKRLEINYSNEWKRPVYVIEFRGKRIEDDFISLCYLRAAKEVLQYHYGAGVWRRALASDFPNIKEELRPFVVFQDSVRPNQNLLTYTGLLRHVEEIHLIAERLHDLFRANHPGSKNSNVIDFRYDIYF